jgi:hypothetical protein
MGIPRLVRLCCWLLAEVLAPVVALWGTHMERRILQHGSPLTATALLFAQQAGIANAHRVRILVTTNNPLPFPGWLLRVAEHWRIGCPHPIGITLGYGICVAAGWQDNLPLISHELIHVRQYEHYGSHWRFHRAYLSQCFYHGYDNAPLELEARAHARD